MHFQFSTQLLALSALICLGISQEVQRRQGHHNNVRGGGIFGSLQENHAIRHLQGNACDLKEEKNLKCQVLNDVGEALFQQQQTKVHVVLDMKKGFCLTDYYIHATIEPTNVSQASNISVDVDNIAKQRAFEKISIPDSCSDLTIDVRTNVSESCPQSANLSALIDMLPKKCSTCQWASRILTSKDDAVGETRYSYWNIEGLKNDFFGTRKLKGWCVDSFTGLGDKFERNVERVISSYDNEGLEWILNHHSSDLELENLPHHVNYLINEYPVGTILPERAGSCAGYEITWTEIQQAIWVLLDDKFHIDVTFDECAVDFLVGEANTAGATYEPTTCDDKVAIVLFFNRNLQPVIVEVHLCDCTPCVPPPEETEEPCITAAKREDLTDEEIDMYENMCFEAKEGDTKTHYYNFTFLGPYEASGWSEKNEVDMTAENDQGAVENINSVHISCSDTFENGYADRDGDGPTQDRNETPVQNYQIIKYKDNCEFDKVCMYCPTNSTSDETGSPSGKSSKTGKTAKKASTSKEKSSKSTGNSGSASGKRGRRALQAKTIVDRCDSVWACSKGEACNSSTYGRL